MRIIAGEAKGREILAPKGMNTRPTLAKVKEAMFGMIQFEVAGAVVLDLFSGSGGLGIEALSRGAERVVFCDSSREAYNTVRSNLKRLGYDERAAVSCCDSIRLLEGLAGSGEAFDIVLLDPPYETDLESRAIAKLSELGLIKAGAILLCEHSKQNPPVFPEGFNVKKARKYGDSFVTYAVYEGVDDI
ncbi:MAG: 16S rRNA (guanine(966)-N(2))-methyltransferase RsmD [Clostridia bacterium]|nr:16S rRNA (guanine(966)-N(2))-methyltransferase RsmD [Clostridia bacterium]